MFKKDPDKSLLNNNDGEVSPHYIAIAKHEESFFCAYLEHWDDFKDTEGSLLMVFRWCILACSVSTMGKEPEGNMFYVNDVRRIMERKKRDMSYNALKFQLHKLKSRGFILPIKKGVYVINPKYGIKGSISEHGYNEIQRLIKQGYELQQEN